MLSTNLAQNSLKCVAFLLLIFSTLEVIAQSQQAYLKASNTGSSSDFFGVSVAISGDTIAVGANSERSSATGVNGDQTDVSAIDAGAVYVFVRDGANWSQQAYLKASNTDARDLFGHSVSIYGDTLVVGAIGEASSTTGINNNQNDNSAADAGAVYVFVREGSTWSQQAYIKASNTDSGDIFGHRVVVFENTLLVGARHEDSSATGINGDQSDNSAEDSGAVYVFTRNGSTWSQQAYLKASNTDAGDVFGRSIAISGETIVVGSAESSNSTGVNGDQNDNSAAFSGAAYVFSRNGTQWSQQAYLKASNTDQRDLFGHAVAISGNTVVVGAPVEASSSTGIDGDQSDNSETNAGAGYVFTRSGQTWSQQAYLKASNTDGGDLFGRNLVLSDQTLVVGAEREDSNATGINGDQSDNSKFSAGAAYVFVVNGESWNQVAYLKASNTDSLDEFGQNMGLHRGSLVIGAPGEDGGSNLVNGDQQDNSVSGAGAAYVFVNIASNQGFTINAGLNGNWWNGPARSGEGVQIEVANAGDGSLVLVATIYSYDIMGNQIFLVAVGPVEGGSAEVDVFITDGGLWGDDFDPALVSEVQWGTGTFTANSCESISMALIPNAAFQNMGYTNLEYELVRLTTPLIPCEPN